MEYLKIDLYTKSEIEHYNILGIGTMLLMAKTDYLMWYKTEEITKLRSVGTKGLLAFNIPAFGLN